MHPHPSAGTLDAVVAGLACVAVIAYARGVVVSRRNGRPWPWHRLASWTAGVVLAACSAVGPLAAAAHDSFTAHMWAHVLGGMAAPVLLVLAAPVTLALRSLEVTPARRLSRLLRSAPARVLAHPVTAALISAGGLWAIYVTPVFSAMQSNQAMHVLLHAHLLAAGSLFTASVVGLDPAPHRPRRMLVAAVLILTIASHGVLAKWLYASPPAGVPAVDAQAGAQLMYVLGAWVEAAVVTLFCAQWYRAAGRRLAREPGPLPSP